MNTVDRIREALNHPEAGLAPCVLDIEDQSQGHLHHAGRGKGGHFKLKIVTEAFVGKTPIQRHQMVYKALGDLMKEDIHAISIEAQTP
jgi:BolA protein